MKFTMLKSSGFSHHIIMVGIILVVAIGGTGSLVASHADSLYNGAVTIGNVNCNNSVTVSLDKGTTYYEVLYFHGDKYVHVGGVQTASTYTFEGTLHNNINHTVKFQATDQNGNSPKELRGSPFSYNSASCVAAATPKPTPTPVAVAKPAPKPVPTPVIRPVYTPPASPAFVSCTLSFSANGINYATTTIPSGVYAYTAVTCKNINSSAINISGTVQVSLGGPATTAHGSNPSQQVGQAAVAFSLGKAGSATATQTKLVAPYRILPASSYTVYDGISNSYTFTGNIPAIGGFAFLP